jgi:hypothetical protein
MPAHLTNMEITVVLPAEKIPLGSTVTKVRGRKEYKLVDRLRVYPMRLADQEAGESVPQEIVAEPGVRFLLDGGTANAILASTELMWTTSGQYLVDWLRRGLDPYKDCEK